MPTYRFVNKETNEEHEQFLFMSELDQFLLDNPQLYQGFNNAAPSIGDAVRLGFNGKPPDSFRDVLRNMKGKHKGSTINTW